MFDMGFFELLVIAVVGLLVIGPERFPGAVRACGLWIGRMKRVLRETRTSLEEQVGVDDIRRQLHNENVMRSMAASAEELKRTVSEKAFATDSELSIDDTVESDSEANSLNNSADKKTS
jgi:sec-independent protein translocase protein TatB